MRKRMPTKISYIVKARMKTREQPVLENRTLVDFLEAHPFYRTLLMAGTLVAVLAFPVDMAWRFLVDRPIQREEAIARAWTIVHTNAVGNSGKVEALQALNRLGVYLTSLDLSCTKQGAKLEPKKDFDEDYRPTSCDYSPYFGNLNLDDGKLHNVNFQGVNLKASSFADSEIDKANITWANADYSNFARARLYSIDFSYTEITNSNFSSTYISDCKITQTHFETADFRESAISNCDAQNGILVLSNFENAEIRSTDFTHAYIHFVNFQGAHFIDTIFGTNRFEAINLSGTEFVVSRDCNSINTCKYLPRNLEQAWAWADREPVISLKGRQFQFKSLKLCDPKLRSNYSGKAFGSIPEGCG